MYANSENIDDVKDAIYENVEDLAIYADLHPPLPVLPDTKHIENNSVLQELILDVSNPQHSPSDPGTIQKVTPDGSSSGISSGNSSSVESPQLSPSDSIERDSGSARSVSRSPDSGIFGLLRPVLTPLEAVVSEDPIRKCIDQTLKQFEKLEEESSALASSVHPHSGIEPPVHCGVPESFSTMPATNEDPHVEDSDINIELSLRADASSSTGSSSSDEEEFVCKKPSGTDGIFAASLVAIDSPPPSMKNLSLESPRKPEVPLKPEIPKKPEELRSISRHQLLSQVERDGLNLIDRQKVKLKRINSWLLDEKGLQSPVDGSCDEAPSAPSAPLGAPSALNDSQDPQTFTQLPTGSVKSPSDYREEDRDQVSDEQIVRAPLDDPSCDSKQNEGAVSDTQFVQPPPDNVESPLSNAEVAGDVVSDALLVQPPLDNVESPSPNAEEAGDGVSDALFVKPSLEAGKIDSPVSTTQFTQLPPDHAESAPSATETGDAVLTTQSIQPLIDVVKTESLVAPAQFTEAPLDDFIYPNGKSHSINRMHSWWTVKFKRLTGYCPYLRKIRSQ